MKRKRKHILILVTLLIIGLLALRVFFLYQKNRHELREAQRLLHDNKIGEAKALFSHLEGASWVKTNARLGSIITAILNDRELGDFSLPREDEVNISAYHLPYLMKKQFALAAYDRCLELAKIGRYYGEDVATLYYAAALLEKGDPRLAELYYSKLPESLKKTIMGNRLKETLKLLHNGSVRVVRDRRGKLIGTLSNKHVFSFYRPEYRHLIQPVVVREIEAFYRNANGKVRNGFRVCMDLELSQLALESLGIHQGSIVLIKPDTGEILAAVSDEVTCTKMGAQASPAFEQMMEPASISKLMTVTAAFRDGLDPNTEIAAVHCYNGKMYAGKFLYCASGKAKLQGLAHALAISCNSAFADLGVKLGWDKMLAELHRYGFEAPGDYPFPFGKIIIKSGDDRALADLSIGLEDTLITPLHAALIASVFAVDGYWSFPELLYAVDGLTGLSPVRFGNLREPKKGTRLVETAWLPVIRDAMNAVTDFGGTASFVDPEGFQVYMKTGTSGNFDNGFHINYIGYGPVDQDIQTIAYCVRVTGKRSTSQVRQAGYRVNEELLLRLKALLEKRETLYE